MLRYYKDVYTHMFILRTLVYANKYIMYEKYVYCLFHGIASVFIIIVVFLSYYLHMAFFRFRYRKIYWKNNLILLN